MKLTVRAGTGLVARIAPIALGAIVANLVENAIKYRSRDRENEVVVTASGEGREIRITVRDRGPGIDPRLLPRVFDPFVRGSERPDSHGLGLATVKRLVDAHRGAVTVESTTGAGTTFTVRLPALARRAAGSVAPAAAVAAPTDGVAAPTAGVRAPTADVRAPASAERQT